MEYPNFYENIPEAVKRLHNTIVMYDGEPYYILAICGHRADNIFRVYMHAVGTDPWPVQNVIDKWHREDSGLGPELDEWMEANKQSPVIRKAINSPKFNKFRPFPMGMCNVDGNVYYLERIPNRKTEQGLISSMVMETPVTAAAGAKAPEPGYSYRGPQYVSLWSNDFKDTLLGRYPDPDLCLNQLLDPEVSNTAAAFNREFALVRGPLNMLFLAYQSEVVGLLPNNDYSRVIIGRDKKHTAEVVSELKLFSNLAINTN